MEPVEIAKPFYLGILGTHEHIEKETLNEILVQIFHITERFPEKMILPAEGKSSIFLEDWAIRHGLPIQVCQADWYKHAKRAIVFRDNRIVQEATHFLIFLNKRSQANEKTALRLARKGHSVFTISYKELEIEQLIVEPEEPRQKGQSKSKSTKKETNETKEKGQMILEFREKV